MDNKEQEQSFKDALKKARITDKGYGRFKKEEIDWIKLIFKDNEIARQTLKKIFMPQYQYDDPMGSISDLWVELNIEQLPPHDRDVHIMARSKMIVHMEKMLNSLWAMSQIKEESPEEKEKRLSMDSNK